MTLLDITIVQIAIPSLSAVLLPILAIAFAAAATLAVRFRAGAARTPVVTADEPEAVTV
jgi:hypothetical protein